MVRPGDPLLGVPRPPRAHLHLGSRRAAALTRCGRTCAEAQSACEDDADDQERDELQAEEDGMVHGQRTSQAPCRRADAP